MFANLTESIKRRLLQELRRFWSDDPNYRDSLVPNIQGRYSFQERPQQGIILKGASANAQSLSADHFQGTVVSYVNLTRVLGHPGHSIEWVREDGLAIQRNAGRFPSPPGVYYIQVLREPYGSPTPSEQLVFYVDPLLEILDERPITLGPRLLEVSHGAFHPGSLRVYEMPGNIVQYEGIQYSADPATGQITLTDPPAPNTYFSIDYRYAAESRGPFLLPVNGSNNNAIPGVVLAFGRRAQENDVMSVVVGRSREACALEYGGRWEINLDMDVMTRDVLATGEVTDRTIMFLYTDLRARFAGEGIDLSQVSMGGEAEEAYDENADDYFYTASVSLTLQTEWSVHVPLNWEFNRILPNTLEEEEAISGLSGDQLYATGSPTGIHVYQNMNLQAIRDPFFVNRNDQFEIIR
jgi:hypothetical protein